ncbi:MAG: hypothetical protein ACREVS_15295 [Burkholderiales bacterium]
MTRDFLLATIAALGLTACGPDLTTETKPPSNLGAAPAQPAEAGKPAGSEPSVAQAEKQDAAQPAAGDTKEDEKKEDGEKKTQ